MAVASEAGNPLRQGDLVAGKYVVERILGEGGMGIVLSAVHRDLGSKVAIKVLRAAPYVARDALARFQREAKAAAKLTSDHVAHVLDVGVTQAGDPYIVMEHLEGADLAATVAAYGALPVPLVAELIMQACEGVGEAHANGIVHRDLKPSNLFLTQTIGGRPRVKVLDFGISKLHEDDAMATTQSSAVLGTPLYMAPEQMMSARDADARADVWSLGVVMFELLTGKLPFKADNVAALAVAVTSSVAPSITSINADLPAEMAEIVARCLVRSPAERLQSVAELASALQPFQKNVAPFDMSLAATVAARKQKDISTAKTELATPTPAVAPPAASTWKRIVTFVPIVAAILWIFGAAYPGLPARKMFLYAGDGAYLVVVAFIVGCVLAWLGKSTRWVALVVCAFGTFGTYTGWVAVRTSASRMPERAFMMMHEGLYEANINRFVAFAFGAGLLLAMAVARGQSARNREDATRTVAAGVFGIACAMTSLWVRVDGSRERSWVDDTLTRYARAKHFVDSTGELRGVFFLGLILVAAAAIYGFFRVRRMPGTLAWRSFAKADVAFVALTLVWLGADIGLAMRLRAAEVMTDAANRPKLELPSDLTPPVATGLAAPPPAPTLKVGSKQTLLGTSPIAPDSMATELSRALAGTQVHDPPLLLLADRATSWQTMVFALRAMRKAGAERVGVLFVRSETPIPQPGDPPEASFVIETDFGMARVEMSSCAPARDMRDWPIALQKMQTVCVGE